MVYIYSEMKRSSTFNYICRVGNFTVMNFCISNKLIPRLIKYAELLRKHFRSTYLSADSSTWRSKAISYATAAPRWFHKQSICGNPA